jgi:hypothetical protein
MAFFAGTPKAGFASAAASALRQGSRFHIQAGNVKNSGHIGPRRDGRRYRPGDTIRQSGIYEVIHDRDHREVHEAVMIGGERFPDCETCKDKVRFRLIRTAPYIFQDEDFGPED